MLCPFGKNLALRPTGVRESTPFMRNLFPQAALAEHLISVVFLMTMIKDSLRKHPKALRLARKLARRSRHSKLEPVYNDAAVAMVEKWSRTIPNKFDLIVGIPRSGLFLASVLALKWGRPLSTPDDLVRGIIWQSSSVPQIQVSDIHSLLLVDDTIHKGTMLETVKKQISDYRKDLEVQVATLFVSGGRTDLADYYVQLKEKPDILEWNLLSSTWGFGKPSSDSGRRDMPRLPQRHRG